LRQRKVLFFSEAVSLAHVARPLVLAKTLHLAGWDVSFASAPQFAVCTGDMPFPHLGIDSISPGRFLERLAAGAPLYRMKELADYILDDQRIIEQERPDLIVGDFRLSLSISARVAGIPYLSICNAHWSPWRKPGAMTVPDIPLVTWFGTRLIEPLFRLSWPISSAIHAAPMNALRKKYGLPPLAGVEAVYTDGDVVLYADTPELVPCHHLPRNHHYLGPILWSPPIAPPDWWDSIPEGPSAYVTLGSTGRAELLPMVIDACEDEGLAVIAATAGRTDLPTSHGRRRSAPFLPGELASARTDLTICNGGSATAYQALAAGHPVLGICSNMDQFLTMSCIEQAHAGRRLRASTCERSQIRADIRRILQGKEHSAGATAIKESFDQYRCTERFVELAHASLAD